MADTNDDYPALAKQRGRVKCESGWHDDGRTWKTWRTYLDRHLLGNAVDEIEAWRWIEDILKMEARNA